MPTTPLSAAGLPDADDGRAFEAGVRKSLRYAASHHFADSVIFVILLTAAISFCVTPLGHLISTLSILLACPTPKCSVSVLWPE